VLSDDVARSVWFRERDDSTLDGELLLHGGLAIELGANAAGKLALRADDPRGGRELWRLALGRATMASPASIFPPAPIAWVRALDAQHVIVAVVTDAMLAVHRVRFDGTVLGVDRLAYVGSVFGPKAETDESGCYAARFETRDGYVAELRDRHGALVEQIPYADLLAWGGGRIVLRNRDRRPFSTPYANARYLGLMERRIGPLDRQDFTSVTPRITDDTIYETDTADYDEWSEDGDGAPPRRRFSACDAATGRQRWQKTIRDDLRYTPVPGAVLAREPEHVTALDVATGNPLARFALPAGAIVRGFDAGRLLWSTADELALAAPDRVLWSIPPPGVGEYAVTIEDDLLMIAHRHSLHVLA
jgi:outer membrane protein assembly factor BamB